MGSSPTPILFSSQLPPPPISLASSHSLDLLAILALSLHFCLSLLVCECDAVSCPSKLSISHKNNAETKGGWYLLLCVGWLISLDAVESRPSRSSRRENMQDRENIPPTTPRKIAKTKGSKHSIIALLTEKVSLQHQYPPNGPSPSSPPPNETSPLPHELHLPPPQYRQTQSSPARKQSSNGEQYPANSPLAPPNAPKSKTSFPIKSRLSN